MSGRNFTKTVLYCALLYCAVLYCVVLYCTVLYCTVLYCTVLYCTILLPWQGPAVPDGGHVIHTGLVAVGQLLEAHFRLPVDRVAALGLNLHISL